MSTVTIHGASDDLIEVEGDIDEEFVFYPKSPEEDRILAFSDGTVLSINYDSDGIWRIKRKAAGCAMLEKVEGDTEKDTNDIATLYGADIRLVVIGFQMATSKK